ncbi:teichoic acid transport system permease protein [Clostridium neonatale]|uniref:ABC transporter permease n=1 Tax=Clostridium neonatale TaxID=137838 RepID=UPI00291C3B0D|nr:ABC transporter permease [Clostridium neonatale]CAI3633726.1 teichoic acid transport system permease protein [Clostridium neonatale]
MNNRKYIKTLLLLVIILLSNVFIIKLCNLDNSSIDMTYDLVSDNAGEYQLFYSNNGEWDEKKSASIQYNEINSKQILHYKIPMNYQYLRFDLGNKSSSITISNMKLSYMGKKVNLDYNVLLKNEHQNQIKYAQKNDEHLKIETNGTDPYITYKISDEVFNEYIRFSEEIGVLVKIILCIVVDVMLILMYKKFKFASTLLIELSSNKKLIWDLSKNDFKTKYAGSYLGIVWAFIQPIVTILVYWFVFQFGLKAGAPMPNVPFIVWFITGLIPWFFFQDSILNATNCMLEYSYLVKKVLFKISILPVVKIVSALFVHLVFVGFLFFVTSIYKFYPTQYTIQLIYYSLCAFCLALVLSYTTSAIVVFFRDLGQIINIFLQIGMWMTPIMWSYTIMPEKYQWILKLNPMYYIVEGYRDAFINKVWFFERPFETIYFWIVILILFVLGVIIFKKLKPHFADVL